MKAPVRAVLLSSVTLLLACASARTSPPAQPQPRWTQHVRANVQLSCEAHYGEGEFCDCLTNKLEVISPDPKKEFTQQELDAGVAACGKPIARVGI
ncbi:MAG TPA: hypothetical protein VFG59_15970 [Anaeromyxobacter sp.]|nr:hypothetical protein [Anaeromyxobacter sp.]